MSAFDLTFVAMAADVPLEPLRGMPTPAEMVTQLLAVAKLVERSSERVGLLQSALRLLEESALVVPDAARLRETVAAQVRGELRVDEQYARLSRRTLQAASRAAARARVRELEEVLSRIAREDKKLGSRRPEVVHALKASVTAHLEASRKLRLARDQWLLRRAVYREYERSVSGSLLQLVKAQPSLDAIKRLDGPSPATLSDLRVRLLGGAERLQRVTVPDEVRSAHDLLIGAWHFAETAVRTRQDAIGTGDMSAAWRASSAAAGALMMLGRVQNELRALVEPPTVR
jgi:hypothetical protein